MEEDKSNLIDLSNSKEECNTLPAPLIRSEENYDFPSRLLFNSVNNPFDQVLQDITNRDDPFERVCEAAYQPVNKHLRAVAVADKENSVKLISPLHTPRLNRTIHTPRDLNDTDSSLQFLSDTFIAEEVSDDFSDTDINLSPISSIQSRERNVFDSGSSSELHKSSFQQPTEKMRSLQMFKTAQEEALKVNQSFSGYNLSSRRNDFKAYSREDEMIFLEASHMANLFSKLAMPSDEIENEEYLSSSLPPWLVDNIYFDDDEKKPANKLEFSPDTEVNKKIQDQIASLNRSGETVESDCDLSDDVNNMEFKLRDPKTRNTIDVEFVPLTEQVDDPTALRYLGESDEEPTSHTEQKDLDAKKCTLVKNLDQIKKYCDLDLKKITKKLNTDGSTEYSMSVQSKTTGAVPKLKVRHDKEKKKELVARGPMKALLPVNSMEKKAPKYITSSSCIPKSPRTSQPSTSQYMRPTTPNKLKFNAPLSQSTPEMKKPIKSGVCVNVITPNKSRSYVPAMQRSRSASLGTKPAIFLKSSLNATTSNKSGLHVIKPLSQSNIPMMKTTMNRSFETKKSNPSVINRSRSFTNTMSNKKGVGQGAIPKPKRSGH